MQNNDNYGGPYDEPETTWPCPVCGTETDDGGIIRTCTNCGGTFAEHQIVKHYE
jgi:rubrerythrin